MKKIAILGATGYIGKSLLQEFYAKENEFSLSLFSRSKAKIASLAKKAPRGFNVTVCSYDEFHNGIYDVIINCTGIGDPLILKKSPVDIFKVTEEMDALVIAYLHKKPKTLYINLSSGAVYGDNFKKSITYETRSILNVNNLSISEYYSIAKINSEAKHRALSHLTIVDIRVFSFFSGSVDIDAGFMVSEIIKCIKHKKVFETNEDNIVRDYVIPKDLFLLICAIMNTGGVNDAFDVYSKKPITKFDTLDFFRKKYGLAYHLKKGSKTNISMLKKTYFSKNKKAERIGYSPVFTSLAGLEYEASKIVGLGAGS